jgi:hypothetical protein
MDNVLTESNLYRILGKSDNPVLATSLKNHPQSFPQSGRVAVMDVG